MKQYTWITVLIAALMLQVGCAGSKKADFSTPEATFETMVQAIEAKDLKAYEACWHPEKAQAEGLVFFLNQNQDTWEMLQSMFKPGAKLVNGRDEDELGRKIRYFDVEASYLKEGDEIEDVGLVQEGNEWKMWHW